MTVYLIRHGKTKANENRLYCGSSDLPLSLAGRAELRPDCYALQDVRFVTSGMKRTQETLQGLFGDVPYTVDPDFREVDFGAFELRSYSELQHRTDYQAWLAGDNEENIPPGGESGKQMRLRALQAYSRLQGDTVVITHGGVIAAIMDTLFPNEHKSRYEWQPAFGCGYMITEGTYRRIGPWPSQNKSAGQ